MRRLLLFLGVHILLVSNAIAQTASYDKAKVLDFFQNQQFDEALQYLTPILPTDSNNIVLLGYVGYAYYMTDNKKEAGVAYQHIFDLDSTNLPALSYLLTLNLSDEKEKAMDFTRRLIILQPTKAAWWRTMGELWRRVNQTDSAFDYLNHARALSPMDPKTIASLADLLIDQRFYPTSDTMLDAALERDSLNLTFLKLRIKSAYQAGDFNNVLVPGERLIRINEPGAVSGSLSWLALSYYNLKKYPDCIRVCEYMLGAGLEFESVFYYEARAWAKQKEYAKSNELLGICLGKAVSKTADWYYYEQGQNYEGLRNFKKAIASYDTAYYLFKDPTMLYNCGRIAESNLNNPTLARKYYTRYLTIAHPDSAGEKAAYAYVRSRWGGKGAANKPKEPLNPTKDSLTRK